MWYKIPYEWTEGHRQTLISFLMISKILLEGRQGVPVTAKDIFSTCNFHLKSGQFDYRHVEGISGLVLMQST